MFGHQNLIDAEIQNGFGARINKVETMEEFLHTFVVTRKQIDHTVDNNVNWEIVPLYGTMWQLFLRRLLNFEFALREIRV